MVALGALPSVLDSPWIPRFTSLVLGGWSPTRLSLIGKQDAGFVTKGFVEQGLRFLQHGRAGGYPIGIQFTHAAARSADRLSSPAVLECSLPTWQPPLKAEPLN
jgi:hypothetical protein